MRTPGNTVAAALAALWLAGCGGFSNDPLESGTVRGRILGAEPDVAAVSVLGQPGLRASVGQDGRFELTDVPATQLELFVVASRTHAARSKVKAKGARVTDVGDILAGPGAFITVRVVDENGQVPPGAELEVDGTHLDDIKVDVASGEVRVGPLPTGCYELKVKADELEDEEEEVCVREGEELTRSITLRTADDGEDEEP